MSILDGLPRGSFAGIEFATERITMHGQGRQHVHEFPHAPGGAPEKLGRGLWYFTVHANFQNTFSGFQAQPKAQSLYPDACNKLRRFYELQITDTFQHPTVGQFQGFIISWRQDYDPKLRSGEKVEFEVLEDQRDNFLTQTSAVQTTSSMSTSQAAIDAQLSAVRNALKMTDADMGLFDALRAGVNSISALSDTGNLYTGLLQAKCLEVSNLCGQLDGTHSMQDPRALGLVDPVHDIWSAAMNIAAQQAAALSTKTTPRTMTVQDLSTWLYNGDVSRASDLLTLNANSIPDPTAIKAGTQIKYFPSP